jgi:hypothetical protein
LDLRQPCWGCSPPAPSARSRFWPMRRSTRRRVAPCADSTAHTAPCRLVAHDCTPRGPCRGQTVQASRSWTAAAASAASRNVLPARPLLAARCSGTAVRVHRGRGTSAATAESTAAPLWRPAGPRSDGGGERCGEAKSRTHAGTRAASDVQHGQLGYESFQPFAE